jgi:hypothetical protein
MKINLRNRHDAIDNLVNRLYVSGFEELQNIIDSMDIEEIRDMVSSYVYEDLEDTSNENLSDKIDQYTDLLNS